MPTVYWNDIPYTAPIGSRISDLPPYKESAALPCGGHGRCGKCRVMAEGALSPLSDTEQGILTPAEQAAGIRLACCTAILGDCRIRLADSVAGTADRAVVRLDGEWITAGKLAPAFTAYGVAVDIGTTTLAARLYDSRGKLLAEAGMLNPQAGYGADVISRMEAAMRGAAADIAALTASAIHRLLEELAAEAGISPTAIDGGVITGNTAMLHLFTETDVEPLTHAPFAARRLFGEELTAEKLGISGLSPATRFYLPPCAAAFVGADITTALLASGIADAADPAPRLLVDIGTNGEMALFHDGTLTFCSTAAGPAFEGAGLSMGMGGKAGAVDRVWLQNGVPAAHVIGETTPVGICGSGVVDAVACLLHAELLDETGYLEEDPALIAPPVCLTQADIRAVQLAKSAIHAGLRTLLADAGIDPGSVAELAIAGGFGSYLNVRNAAYIGLLPDELLPAIRVLGNAALAGASLLLLDCSLRPACTRLASGRVLELSTHPVFAAEYMDQMFF